MGRNAEFDDTNNNKILQMYQAGLSLKAIAIKLNTYPETIKRKLIKMGQEIRDVSQSMKTFHKNKKEK